MEEHNLYYTSPTDEIFEEIKQSAIEIWKEYDNTYGYSSEKVDRIKDIGNVSDNAMFIVAMFDSDNQRKLADKLSNESRKAIKERMLAGGNSEDIIPF